LKKDPLGRARTSLSASSKFLEDAAERREKLIKDSRDVLSSCSKAIVGVHTGDLSGARAFINKAKEGLEALRRVSSGDMDKYVVPAEVEYVEAVALFSLATGKPLPGKDELGAEPGAYVLGLLDAIGEAKRRMFDKVREGQLDEAMRLFEIMETLYVLMKPLAVYDNLVPGLRHKLDVDRSILEDVRSLVTEETRRTKLLKTMSDFANKLDATKG
jgi:translin